MISLRKIKSDWGIPLALLLLAAVPFVFGIVRLGDVAAGKVTADNARFLSAPLPIVLHVISSSLFSVAGALQFAPALRLHFPVWHRRAGQILIVSGIVSGLSGIWMNQFYVNPNMDEGHLLYGFRLFFGAAMVWCMVLGYVRIRNRDLVRHQVWMIRGYAIGAGTGSQVFVYAFYLIFFPMPGLTGNAMLTGAAWIINLAVVEWVMFRARSRAGGLAASA